MSGNLAGAGAGEEQMVAYEASMKEAAPRQSLVREEGAEVRLAQGVEPGVVEERVVRVLLVEDQVLLLSLRSWAQRA